MTPDCEHEGKQARQDPPTVASDAEWTGVRGTRMLHPALHLQPRCHLLAARRPGVPQLQGEALGGGQGLNRRPATRLSGRPSRWLPIVRLLTLMLLVSTFPCVWTSDSVDTTWSPAVDVFTRGKDLVVRAELPGVNPEKDISVSCADGMLTISGDRRHQDKVEDQDFYGFESS